ncbi:MAG: hypothetical protein A2X87_00480 [Deltaproteobacteria bacterium GWC2_42_51]|nr:MAG: hypothetical protein A2056_01500 [Deltaproteobacteria bacterium GWA2_42_85]OGP29152.1 MAG: hypothetical protein A2067_05665 [Deltaproteobacteria bacterium GWB2_42_7]OGP31880.1 MAG: hypothetical protein A2X87_00480 [Deltaproteobacteria bacterium GWC2_42_51]OGP43436.1 MAG: hypothetical protein A2090_10650 [Deltaproteobacteria bacterium GWD2_42_10]OGP46297.1 MAG: hypothetical protein A2022_11110 [Deltaproteobacteria bacterium GWF2_42_12]OGQ30417.1 MAG: hypothetical protein A3D29_05635 [De
MIDSYEFGRIVIDGKTYDHDVIILSDKIKDNWWRKEGHKLYLADIEPIFRDAPQTVIIGTGASGMMKVEEEVRKGLSSKNIEIIIAETKKACETYNKVCKTRKTAATLHLTC